MRITLFIVGVCFILCSGCQLVPTDFIPRATWYWSADAKQYRKERAQEKAWEAKPVNTNSPAY